LTSSYWFVPPTWTRSPQSWTPRRATPNSRWLPASCRRQRCSNASGRANDAFRNAFNERRRSTTSPVATIGVDWATHCMHIGRDGSADAGARDAGTDVRERHELRGDRILRVGARRAVLPAASLRRIGGRARYDAPPIPRPGAVDLDFQ